MVPAQHSIRICTMLPSLARRFRPLIFRAWNHPHHLYPLPWKRPLNCFYRTTTIVRAPASSYDDDDEEEEIDMADYQRFLSQMGTKKWFCEILQKALLNGHIQKVKMPRYLCNNGWSMALLLHRYETGQPPSLLADRFLRHGVTSFTKVEQEALYAGLELETAADGDGWRNRNSAKRAKIKQRIIRHRKMQYVKEALEALQQRGLWDHPYIKLYFKAYAHILEGGPPEKPHEELNPDVFFFRFSRIMAWEIVEKEREEQEARQQQEEAERERLTQEGLEQEAEGKRRAEQTAREKRKKKVLNKYEKRKNFEWIKEMKEAKRLQEQAEAEEKEESQENRDYW